MIKRKTNFINSTVLIALVTASSYAVSIGYQFGKFSGFGISDFSGFISLDQTLIFTSLIPSLVFGVVYSLYFLFYAEKFSNPRNFKVVQLIIAHSILFAPVMLLLMGAVIGNLLWLMLAVIGYCAFVVAYSFIVKNFSANQPRQSDFDKFLSNYLQKIFPINLNDYIGKLLIMGTVSTLVFSFATGYISTRSYSPLLLVEGESRYAVIQLSGNRGVFTKLDGNRVTREYLILNLNESKSLNLQASKERLSFDDVILR